MSKPHIKKEPGRVHQNAIFPKVPYREARVVNIRCKTHGTGVKDHQVMVFSSGEMLVMVNQRGFPGYAPAKQVGMTKLAACRAWAASGWKVT